MTRQPSVALGSAKYRPGSAIICRRSLGGKCASCNRIEESVSAVIWSCKLLDLHCDTSRTRLTFMHACITAQRDPRSEKTTHLAVCSSVGLGLPAFNWDSTSCASRLVVCDLGCLPRRASLTNAALMAVGTAVPSAPPGAPGSPAANPPPRSSTLMSNPCAVPMSKTVRAAEMAAAKAAGFFAPLPTWKLQAAQAHSHAVKSLDL